MARSIIFMNFTDWLAGIFTDSFQDSPFYRKNLHARFVMSLSDRGGYTMRHCHIDHRDTENTRISFESLSLCPPCLCGSYGVQGHLQSCACRWYIYSSCCKMISPSSSIEYGSYPQNAYQCVLDPRGRFFKNRHKKQ